jgi:hypothetical protein
MFQLGAIRTGWMIFFLHGRESKSRESKINQLDGIVECCGHLRHTLLISSLSLLAYTTASSSQKMMLLCARMLRRNGKAFGFYTLLLFVDALRMSFNLLFCEKNQI